MGASYIARLSAPAVALGVGFGVAVAVLASPTFWPLALSAAAISSAAVTALAIRKINGVNGDVLGAITVVASLAILVVSSTAERRYTTRFSVPLAGRLRSVGCPTMGVVFVTNRHASTGGNR